MFGFVAAGYTTFAGYLGLMFFHYWGAVVSYKKNVFDLKQLMIYLVVLFGVGILLQAVFDLFIIRYGFMILISIILWLRKKELIFNLLRNILKK
jgi:O-antigen/teichoic acid export membrane protein